jgi:hypothetical protein
VNENSEMAENSEQHHPEMDSRETLGCGHQYAKEIRISNKS